MSRCNQKCQFLFTELKYFQKISSVTSFSNRKKKLIRTVRTRREAKQMFFFSFTGGMTPTAVVPAILTFSSELPLSATVDLTFIDDDMRK